MPSEYVREMVLLPDVTRVPKAGENFRGVINLRGKVLPVLDLRKRLGFKTVTQEVEELVELLKAWLVDHENCLKELDACIKENREFKMQRDPTKCAFGKWYNSFKTDNMLLAQQLKRFDSPHRTIHATADLAFGMVESGRREDAIALLEETRSGTLAILVGLFADTISLIRTNTKEISVVLESLDHHMAATVDRVESVEELKPGTRQNISEAMGMTYDEYISGVARRKRDDAIVLLLDPVKILRQDIIPAEAFGQMSAGQGES